MKRLASPVLIFSFFLAGVISFLTSVIPSSFAQEKETLTAKRNLNIREGVPAPGCMENFTTWNNSNTYKKTPWDLSFIRGENEKTNLNKVSQWPRREHFVDINADGLLDYMYAHSLFRERTGGNWQKEARNCIAINNGSGWDLTYQCYGTQSKTGDVIDEQYWGDCADMSA